LFRSPNWLHSYRIQDSRLQQVEFGSAEHLALDIFEPIYLPLCWMAIVCVAAANVSSEGVRENLPAFCIAITISILSKGAPENRS
jgi:hypothetical protein